MPEKPFLLEQNNGYSYGDAGIGNIKYGPEEDEAGSSTKPGRIVTLNQGKVKHIHYLALHQGGISTTFREQSCCLNGAAAAENHSIKNRINNIAQGSGHNHGKGDYQTGMCLDPNQVAHV